MTIHELHIGQWAEVIKVGGEGATRLHFLDMGLIPGAVIKVVDRAPVGDPIQIQINGYALTLRSKEADEIEVRLHEPKETSGKPDSAASPVTNRKTSVKPSSFASASASSL